MTQTTSCPECGDVQPDFDGLGHLYCEICNWCEHASMTEMKGWGLMCDFCGRTENEIKEMETA